MNNKKVQATRSRHTKSFLGWTLRDVAPYFAGAAALQLAIATFTYLPSNKSDASEASLSSAEEHYQTAIQMNITEEGLIETQSGAEPQPEEEQAEPVIYTVKSGDNMGILFRRAGLGNSIVHKLAYETEHGEKFTNLRPGKHFEFIFDAENEIKRIDYVVSPLERYVAIQAEDGFDTRHEIIEPDVLSTLTVGSINSSFYLAGQNAGLTDNLILELANIFGWDIDFILDIRKGDTFSVLYEEQYLEGEKIGNGNILAAEFINRGKSHKAVRYENTDGRVAYYAPDGESMRKAFLRTPLDVFRISSHFNLSRKHPVLNTIRAHKGVDYAASRGTPIKATGSGRITYASAQGGYGNVVKIQHAQSYKTVYAHMDKFASGVNVGKTVEQGDTIGYVGSTGLATGPHLHYEFYVNGAVRDPITVDLPNGTPVPNDEMERFKAFTQQYLTLLDNVETQYASTKADVSSGI